MNILGEGFPKEIIKQIETRQEVYGSGYANGISRTNDQLVYLNANTAWCKLVSSTDIDQLHAINNPIIKQLGLKGTDLAKRFILFNGVQDQGEEQRSGITPNTNLLGNNNAYGIGGTDFGINPMMGIQTVSVTHENRGSLRTATVKLKAWNKTQLEIIDVLYLRLGFSVLLEWGNSMYYDDKGVLQTKQDNSLADKFLEPGAIDYNIFLALIKTRKIQSSGNYDAMFAKVKNFHWSFLKDGSYDVTIDLISSGDIIESLKINAIVEDPLDVEITKEPKPEDEEDEDDIIDYYQKISSIGQFFYFLKYQLTDGTFKKDGDQDRITFSFSDYVDSAAEAQNEEIKSGNNQDAIAKGTLAVVLAAAPIPIIGEIVAVVGLAVTFCNWMWNEDEALISTSYSKKMFEVHEPDGKLINGIVDAISIPWDDKNGDDEIFYVRLGTFLAYLQNYLLPTCYTKNNKPYKMLNFDYEQNSNLMYLHKWQISTDPRICAVGRRMNIPYYDDLNVTIDEEFCYDCSPIVNEKFNGIKQGIEYGNIMNVYVNMTYILNKIDELKDDKNQTSLYDLMKAICDGINEGLGGINALEPVIDEESNTLRIIDANPLPNKEEVINKINELFGKDLVPMSNELASFDLYGYSTIEPTKTDNLPVYNGKGHASFIKDFNFATEITPAFATMISVGAAANGKVVGANQTALSKLNIGLSDRFKNEVLDIATIKKEKLAKAVEAGHDVAELDRQMDALKERYKITLKNYFEFILHLGDNVSGKSVNEPTMITEDVDSYKGTLNNIVQLEDQIRNDEYTKLKLIEGTDINIITPFSPGTGFIPFNLSLTMDGLSGMKIYSKFIVDTSYLPSNYPENVEFLIKGISHDIAENKWTTKLESFCISKGKLEETGTNNSSGGSSSGDANGQQSAYIDPNLKSSTCGTPITTVSPITFNNKSNPKYIKSFNTAIYNTFRGGKGESGMCSKYTYSVASALVNSLKNQAPGPQFLSGKGNAKDTSTRNFLTSLGYTITKVGENLSKPAAQQLLNSQTYNIGDIVIYWANDGNQQDSQNKYGHIEIYSGKVWNPYNYTKPQTNFVSSVPDNYTINPFVYGKKENNCWTVYICRVPNI
jgi:hypothetical protein